MKIDVAGVFIDNLSMDQAIFEIDRLVRGSQSSYITTPYSELIVFAQKDTMYKKVLNGSALALPDAISILWAASYLKLNVKSKKLKEFECFFQLLYSLIRLLFDPRSTTNVIKDRVVGSHLIWDLAALASEKNYSLALVGGSDAVAAETAYKLKSKYPNLKIKLALSGMPFDQKLIDDIKASNSDILLIAYSPPRQEFWLAENIHKLNVKVAIGLGGTFDYIAGKRLPAPRFLHNRGLEWLWRLITQPWRIKRIWNAVPVFIWTVYKYKVNR